MLNHSIADNIQGQGSMPNRRVVRDLRSKPRLGQKEQCERGKVQQISDFIARVFRAIDGKALPVFPAVLVCSVRSHTIGIGLK